MARKALGRGIGALIGGDESGKPAASSAKSAAGGEEVRKVPLNKLEPSSLQPRKTFSEDQLDELTASIRERGIIQPLIVRARGAKFELIAGERRWRASQAAGLKEVPVIVRKASDSDVLEMALIENLQRADLNPIEEAEGYALLAQKFKLTQEDISKRVGKSRASVANALRLRSLSPEVRGLVKTGRLSVGHGKVLLAVDDQGEQEALAHEVVRKDLSVRQTEQLLKKSRNPPARQKKKRSGAVADWRDLEQQVQRAVGTRVRLVGSADKGKLEIHYFNESELERVLAALGVKMD